MQVKMRSELERIFLVRHAFMPVIISARKLIAISYRMNMFSNKDEKEYSSN